MENKKIELPAGVIKIFDMIKEYGSTAFVVGGSVRDSIIGREVHDWDICTPVPVSELQVLFEEHGYKVIPTGIKHGTITVLVDGVGYEVTTYRRDGEYSDGRHPDNVEYTSNLEDDLARRDFTMNAIAYNPEVGFVDPFCGMEDIKDNMIRCVGNPEERFKEDALRILRMWRFVVQLRYGIEDNTFDAANKLAGNLENISKERIQSEFVKMIEADKMCFLFRGDEFLPLIIPEWKDMDMEQNNPYHIYSVEIHSLVAYCNLLIDSDNILRIATLLHDIGKPHCYQDDPDGIRHFRGHGKVSAEIAENILKRLKFDNNTTEKVVELIKYHDATFQVGKKYVKRWLNKIGYEQFDRLLELRKADILAHNPDTQADNLYKVYQLRELLENISEEDECFTLKNLAIDGQDVMDCLNIPSGKGVGRWLQTILDKVIDGELENNREELLDMLIMFSKQCEDWWC